MARKKKIMTPPPQKDAPPPPEQLLLLPPSPPPQEDAATPPRPPPLPILAVWLFKKKLNRRDVSSAKVVIEEYHQELKAALDKLVEEEERYLRITAEDPLGKFYQLRFANHTAGNYAVFHQWGEVVIYNKLREGDIVECWGNFIGDEIHANLRIEQEMPAVVNQPPEKEQESPENPEEEEQDSPVKNLLKDVTAVTSQIMDILKETPVEGETAETDQEPEGQIPVENQGPESEKLTKEPALKEPEILFEKNLEYGDVQPGLDRLVFKRCSAKLKAALEITPSIRVSTVEHTSMLFKRYVVEDLYTLCRDWRRVVTKHALKIGDSVAGFGNDVGGGEFRVKFYIRRDEKKDAGRKTLLLLGKDPKTVVGRVVINCTSKEVGELVVAGQGKMEGFGEKGGDFARFSAKGANGVKYEWSEEVDDDRLSKSVNGAEVGDGEVQMRIDVYKGLRH